MDGFTCSFCGKGRHAVARLISGPRVFICDECVGLCNDIIGEERPTPDNGTMERVRWLVASIAPVNVSVLIRGAPGVGKSFFARTIHRLSGRTGEFVTVSCDAPERQIAIDLFGNEPTAKIGCLEATRGGTVFLESIDRLPLGPQAMLLRTLEQGAVIAVGGVSPRPIDVRVIASTHQELSAACDDRTFRSDLHAHLSAATIAIPSLRQRIDDVPRLVFEFLQAFSAEFGRATSPKLTPEAMERLRRYPWPGNVGQLQAVIRRALLLSDGPEISTDDLTVELPAALANPGADLARAPETLSSGDATSGDATSEEKTELKRVLEAMAAAAPRAASRKLRIQVSDPTGDGPEQQCSLCGDSESQVRMLFRGADAQICAQCVEEAQAMTCSATRQPDEAASPRPGSVVEGTELGCAFCRKGASDVGHLVGAAAGRLICDTCLDGYDQFLGERFSTDWPRGRTFTLRTVYPATRIDDTTDQVRDDLTRRRPCRIVVLVDDGKSDPARLLLDRMKASLADIADFWEADRQDRAVELTAIALPRPD